jgi:hypothetical protein
MWMKGIFNNASSAGIVDTRDSDHTVGIRLADVHPRKVFGFDNSKVQDERHCEGKTVGIVSILVR